MLPHRLLDESEELYGVPPVAQWVKNLTAVALVAGEAQVWSSAWLSGLKDPALPQLWLRSQLQLRFNPRPRNFHMLWVQPLKKRKTNTSLDLIFAENTVFEIPYDITYIWNLIYSTNEPFYRKETNSRTWRTDLWLGERGSGMDWKFRVSRCKLLHVEWISNEILLYSTGNTIQSLVMEHDGR